MSESRTVNTAADTMKVGKAPQKQCKQRERHDGHHYPRRDGLICWCQGRLR